MPRDPGDVSVEVYQISAGSPCLVFDHLVWNGEQHLPGPGTYRGTFHRIDENHGSFTPFETDKTISMTVWTPPGPGNYGCAIPSDG